MNFKAAILGCALRKIKLRTECRKIACDRWRSVRVDDSDRAAAAGSGKIIRRFDRRGGKTRRKRVGMHLSVIFAFYMVWRVRFDHVDRPLRQRNSGRERIRQKKQYKRSE